LTPPSDDHDCGWKKHAEAQAAEIALLKEKLEAIERRMLGKKSERLKSSKLPPPLPSKSDPEAITTTRKDVIPLLTTNPQSNSNWRIPRGSPHSHINNLSGNSEKVHYSEE
jgi:hypothetical protein